MHHPLTHLTRRTRRPLVGVAAGAAAAALLLSITGCSSASDAQTDDGQTTLKVYGWKGSDTEPANIAEINDAFSKAHPEIDLQFESVPPNDAYTQRVQPELLAGDSADVIMTDSAKVQTWGEAGYLEPLDDLAGLDSVLPEITPFISQDDTPYALPMEIIGIDLYANTDLLAKAGITDVPTTWPEFEADLATLKDAGITPLSLPNKNGWTGAATINAIAATKVYQENPDWDAQFLAGTASFSDWIPSIEQFQSLDTSGAVNFADELGVDEWSQGLPDFTAGKSAFWVQGAWNGSAVADAGVNSVFIPWPAGDEGVEPSVNLFAGTMWSINARSSVKDAAKEYLDFWADAKNAAPYLTAENAVSPFEGAKTPTSDMTKDFVAAFEAGRYRILPSDTWSGAEGEKTMQQQTQALMLGQLTPQEYADALDTALRPSK
jgi:raffinose/stachyose/melibiose transport system substrate-binding protein